MRADYSLTKSLVPPTRFQNPNSKPVQSEEQEIQWENNVSYL